ncbi:hypothetical protein CYLTODRAFT_492707 [Cylindrobasidium torrendii FP15055 ss-10]|uniref:Uncharacterized protein n=1 Tax=Cylindrobasidium torrendii FP15055 ss-10 TaxID=1314674 RepID=A0A0D7B616_9AGAR|nr:hypothetical protein CYLTODRAFT_492707 [Cylindrobasidium torrendii FP15055 ss-10]
MMSIEQVAPFVITLVTTTIFFFAYEWILTRIVGSWGVDATGVVGYEVAIRARDDRIQEIAKKLRAAEREIASLKEESRFWEEMANKVFACYQGDMHATEARTGMPLHLLVERPKNLSLE